MPFRAQKSSFLDKFKKNWQAKFVWIAYLGLCPINLSADK